VPDLLVDPPAGENRATVLLAHGAGAPMDGDAMNGLTAALTAAGFTVARFEFAYMAARRSGARRPPPKAELLVPEYRRAVAAVLACSSGPVVIAGKSLGGRVAVMAAGEPLDPRVVGVAVYGYPFHPPGAPERTRLAPLAAARLPVLVCQGTRDPFGTAEDVAAYALPPHVRVRWFEDGDHDLAPRKASGHTLAGHKTAAAAAFAALLDPPSG
jgi:predicted alpha/beta-hydrolase family hydrolase